MIPDSTTILHTIHGSRLYGMHNEDSDYDVFRVVYRRNRGLVTFQDGLDYREFSFDKFMSYVYKGSHQSVEALFSPVARIDHRFEPFLKSIRVTGGEVFETYRRTMRSFSFGDFKKRRHAIRLGINLRQLMDSGRMNPIMNNEQLEQIDVMASLFSGQELFDEVMESVR